MVKVVAIAGWDRSGSTILAEVLGSAEGVISVGEVNNLWQRGVLDNHLCGCGEPFARCAMWSEVMRRAFPGEAPEDVAGRAIEAMADLGNLGLARTTLPVVGQRTQIEDDAYAGMLVRLYDAIADVTGVDVIVDSAKIPWHVAVTAGLPGVDTRIVHLVRDPRGVAYSLQKKVRYDPDAGRATYMDRHGPWFASLAWAYRTRLIDQVWKDDARLTVVRYEDIMAEPQTAVANVMAAVGEGHRSVPFTADGAVRLSPGHSVSGNPSRFNKADVPLVVDDTWRRELAPGSRRIVQTVTWPLLRTHGYARSPRQATAATSPDQGQSVAPGQKTTVRPTTGQRTTGGKP